MNERGVNIDNPHYELFSIFVQRLENFVILIIINVEKSPDSDYNVQTLALSQLACHPAHSFDLVKCDLEGAEWELITNYVSLLENSKFLVMEWHSWHQGGGSFKQIERRLSEIGFEIIRTKDPEGAVGREGKVGLILAENLNY